MVLIRDAKITKASNSHIFYISEPRDDSAAAQVIGVKIQSCIQPNARATTGGNFSVRPNIVPPLWRTMLPPGEGKGCFTFPFLFYWRTDFHSVNQC